MHKYIFIIEWFLWYTNTDIRYDTAIYKKEEMTNYHRL